MHEERPSYLQRSRMATEDIKTNIMPFFFLLLWAGGREESVQGSEGEYGGQKKKSKNHRDVSKTHAKKEERGAQQWWFQLCKGEDFVCMKEERKKESSLLIEFNQIFSAGIEQTFLLPCGRTQCVYCAT